MGSQSFGFSSPSPSLLSFLITICLVLLILVILAFFCIIVFLLLALFLAFCNVLLDWIQHGTPAARNLEVGQSIHLRQNDQNPSGSSTVHENMTWLKILWMKVWERVWGNQGGLELFEPRLDQFFQMIPPPVKYKIHVRTSGFDECVICLDNFLDGDYCRVFPLCKHIFHLDCIDNWLNNHATCPICRQCVAMCDNLQKYVPQHSWG